MENLSEKKCEPIKRGESPLSEKEAREYLSQLHNWELAGSKKIRRTFAFNNSQAGEDFANEIKELAQKEGHNPDVNVAYKKVSVALWTHTVDGLSKNDFILAAKIDKMLR